MLPAVENLKKDTLEATYEHVNRIIKSNSAENFNNIQEFVKYNEKLNVFEKKVQAIVVDSLQIKEGVINGLLSDDLHVIRRVLKCDWFFEDVSLEFYENTIFPNVSFSTRCKIISKLSRNIKSEEQAEQLFQYIRYNYGIKYAEMFLPKCSSQFISTYITECKPLFHHNGSVKILINICKRFPDIAMTVLESVVDKEYPYKSKKRRFAKLISYVAKNFPSLFLPFYEKYCSEIAFFRLGKKLTKNFSRQLKGICKNSSDVRPWEVISKNVLFKCLTFDEQVDFLDSLVRAKNKELSFKNWSLALPILISLMTLKSPNERIRLLESTFSKIYNQNLFDHPELWTLSFLEVLPLEYRTNYVDTLRKMKEDDIMKLKLHEECDDREREIRDIFVYLMSCKSAFPLFKELMNKMTTTARRSILLKEMIKNCIINDDAEGLETVLVYLLKRHKNDDPRILIQLFGHLRQNSPKLLNQKLWDLMEQMATMLLLNVKEYFFYASVMEDNIRYRLKNKLDVQAQVNNMVKLNFMQCQDFGLVQGHMSKPFSKDLIVLYSNEIFNMFDVELVEDKVQRNLVMALLRAINGYNFEMKRNRIDVREYPRLLEEIDKLVDKCESDSDSSILAAELMKDPHLRDRCMAKLQASLLSNHAHYLLKFKPDYFVSNIGKIMDDLSFSYGKFKLKEFRILRCRFDFLNVTSKIEKIAYENFTTDIPCSKKTNLLKAYSCVANIEDFTELVKDFIPLGDNTHLGKDNWAFLEIQMTVPQVIKNVKPDSKNWPLISKYLNGDFLRRVLTSFNSACHNTPIQIILPILKEYSSSKFISVTKVILQKMSEISMTDEKLQYFRERWDKEKHSSVRSVIFQTITKCFLDNPSNETFDILKKCISEADEVTIEKGPSISKMPDEYLNEYIMLLWKFTDELESSRFAMNFRSELIRKLTPKNFSVLSDEFCDMIIRCYLFDDTSKIDVNQFCCYYLTSNPICMNQKLQRILQLMGERRNNYASVSSFLTLLRHFSVKDPELFVGVFDGILEEWPKIYKKVEMFDKYLLLKYARGYNTILKNYEFRKDAPVAQEFGKEFRAIVNEVPDYDYFVGIFKKTVTTFVSDLTGFDLAAMIINFLGRSFGRAEAFIAIEFIPRSAIKPYGEVQGGDFVSGASEKFKDIINKLKELDDDVIKIHMNLRFENETV